MEKIIKNIVENKRTCYFVSPHLDDAAFSAGGLISYLAPQTNVVVINVFTHAGSKNHSLSAKAYLKTCGYKDSTKLFADRRSEDKEVFSSIGAETKDLKFTDALWRPIKHKNLLKKAASLMLNDFKYIYPTHKLHVSKGKIDNNDQTNLKKIEKKLKEIIGSDNEAVVFCPLGVGKHVDHIVTRQACKNTFSNTVYWEDFPYSLYHELETKFIEKEKLAKQTFKKNQQTRKKMFYGYKTQIGKIFDGKDFNLSAETYYTNHA